MSYQGSGSEGGSPVAAEKERRSASVASDGSGDGGRNKSSRRSASRSPSRSRSRSPKSRSRRSKRSRSRSRSRSPRRSSGHSRRRRSRSYSPPPYTSGGRRGYGGGGGGYSPPYGRPGRGRGGQMEAPPNRCVGVFGMSLYTTERDVRDYFEKFGPIEQVQMVYDHPTGRSRGFGFIYFETTDDAIEAKERGSGIEIDGHRIRVDYSNTQRPHTPTPGIYMGRPGSGRDGGRGYDRGGGHGGRRSPSPYRSRRRSRSASYSPRRD